MPDPAPDNPNPGATEPSRSEPGPMSRDEILALAWAQGASEAGATRQATSTTEEVGQDAAGAEIKALAMLVRELHDAERDEPSVQAMRTAIGLYRERPARSLWSRALVEVLAVLRFDSRDPALGAGTYGLRSVAGEAMPDVHIAFECDVARLDLHARCTDDSRRWRVQGAIACIDREATGVRIRSQSAPLEVETIVPEDGAFSALLPAGRYEMSVELDDGAYAFSASFELQAPPEAPAG